MSCYKLHSNKWGCMAQTREMYILGASVAIGPTKASVAKMGKLATPHSSCMATHWKYEVLNLQMFAVYKHRTSKYQVDHRYFSIIVTVAKVGVRCWVVSWNYQESMVSSSDKDDHRWWMKNWVNYGWDREKIYSDLFTCEMMTNTSWSVNGKLWIRCSSKFGVWKQLS